MAIFTIVGFMVAHLLVIFGLLYFFCRGLWADFWLVLAAWLLLMVMCFVHP